MLEQAILFTLASTLCAYPEPEYLEEIQTLLPVLEQQAQPSAQGLAQMLRQLNVLQLQQLQSDYIDLFDRGHLQNPIYETEYGRNRAISKSTELADLAGFYRAFGLLSEGLPEMPDHIAVELEFYAWLLLKENHLQQNQDTEGLEIVKDARQAFLKQHLGGFSQSLPKCPGILEHPVYALIFDWLADIVKQACEQAGVEADPVAFFQSQQEPEDFGCSLGGCGPAGERSLPVSGPDLKA